MADPRCRDCGGSKWTPGGLCAGCRSFPTLGYDVWDFVEASCAIPDRDVAGEPFLLTDEQARFLLWHYRIRPGARRARSGGWELPFFFHRGSQLVRPQKWGKGPLAAALVCAEAAGPVVFDGWSADGQPVGRPWPTPLIQVAAVSLEQGDNIWAALVPMIEEGAIAADIPDTGVTRINLPDGGRIEPVTAAAKSRLGQRVTFCAQDQTESWTQSNGLRAVADTQRRNLAGMGGRWLSTPNAWDPAEESVAQWTSEHEHDGVYHDDVEPPDSLSVRNKAERRKALKVVYGDSHWVNLDRVDAEIVALLPRDPGQAERWFLNRKNASEGRAFNIDEWDACADTGHVVPEGALVTVGVDGARWDDALAVVATEVETGFQWPIGIWERPAHAGDDYEHPLEDVDGYMIEAAARFDICRVYVDPQRIDALLVTWQGRYGDKIVKPWWTNAPKRIGFAVRSYQDAIKAMEVRHDGDEMFRAHVRQAVRMKLNLRDDEGQRLYSLQKDRHESPRKIDAAMAGVISWAARSDAIADGTKAKKKYRVASFA